MSLYDYRRQLDQYLDREIADRKDKLVSTRDYQKADELRGYIQGLQAAKQAQDDVLPEFLQVTYGPDDDESEGLTDQA